MRENLILAYPVKLALWVFLGSFITQLAWIMALPPFRGSDEFDHAYRAASVAHGHWLPSGAEAQGGRGELVEAPISLIKAAEPMCSALRYTGFANCHPVGRIAHGYGWVASGAAKYNPLFYWPIGWTGSFFDGSASLYAMRVAASLLCSLLLAGAAWATGLWASTRWPGVALMAAMTPVALYSNALPAPNGVEWSAAVGLWSCLLGLQGASPRIRRQLLLSATVFGMVLAVVRGLGPLWLALIILTWLIVVGGSTAWALARADRAATGVAVAGCLAAAAGGAVWTLWSGSMRLEAGTGRFPHAVVHALLSEPLWLLQEIAAFPRRNDPAPGPVYAAGLIALGALLVSGWRAAQGRMRWSMASVAAASIAVPFVLEVRAYPLAGSIWQGRYGWPFSLGALVLCGFALDQRTGNPRIRTAWLVAGGTAFASAHIISVLAVLRHEMRISPLADDPRWLAHDPRLAAVLALAGMLTFAIASSLCPLKNRGPGPSFLSVTALDAGEHRPPIGAEDNV